MLSVEWESAEDGEAHPAVSTQALGEASYRVSRYLYMQLVVNMLFGIPFGIALYFIGIPNAMLWGLRRWRQHA